MFVCFSCFCLVTDINAGNILMVAKILIKNFISLIEFTKYFLIISWFNSSMLCIGNTGTGFYPGVLIHFIFSFKSLYIFLCFSGFSSLSFSRFFNFH